MCPGYKTFIRYMICKYFFQMRGLFFHFLSDFPSKRQHFRLQWNPVYLFIFIFPVTACMFDIMSKNSLPNSESQRFSSMCSSRSFVILPHMFSVQSIGS